MLPLSTGYTAPGQVSPPSCPWASEEGRRWMEANG